MSTSDKLDKFSKEELEEMFKFLDQLQESAVVNMLGAGVYIQDTFGVDKYTARKVLQEWINNYDERHP